MSDAQDFEELLVACLSRIETEGEAGLEVLCRDHPEQAALLRERVRLLRGVGLLAAAEGERPETPERLGDFRLVRRLAQGELSVVYLAEQESLGRRVALELIRPEKLYSPGARQRFAREVEAVARLAHPGIVPVHALGEEAGIPFFAMEYVRGASLESVVDALRGRNPAVLTGHDLFLTVVGEAGYQPGTESAQRPPFDDSWSAACSWIAREVAQALEHAHQRGVLHRDVKPSNVMLTPEGRVLLLGFGLDAARSSAILNDSGARVGSLAYMAPEQVDGRHDRISRETDVYALGVTLYELLALRRPFAGSSPTEVQRAILTGAAPGLRSVVPTSSGDAAAVLSKAMALEAPRRYATAADLARDLTRLREHRPVEALTAGPWLELARWAQLNRAAAVALGLALMIAVGGPLALGLEQLRQRVRVQAEQVRAVQERDTAYRARDEADEQRTILERELVETTEQRSIAEREGVEARVHGARAEEHLGQALEAVKEMLRRVAETELVESPQMERVRRDLLDAARRSLDELVASAEWSPTVRWQAAGVAIELADIERVLGDEAAAAAGLRDQIVVLRDLVDETGEGRHRAGLALALARLAQHDCDRGRAERALELTAEGLSLLEEGLVLDVVDDKAWNETLHARREAFVRLDRRPDALRAADRLLEVTRRQLGRDPESTNARRLLAVALAERGRLALGREPEEAVDHVGRALDILRELMDDDPSDGLARLHFCDLSMMLTSALGLLGRREDSYAVSTEAVAVAGALVRDFPTVVRLRRQLQNLRVNLGLDAMHTGRVEAGLDALTRASEGLEELAAADPRDVNLRHSLGEALSSLSALYLENDRFEEAGEPLERAIGAHRAAVAHQPKNDFYRLHLGRALASRGLLAIEAGAWQDVPRYLDEALPLVALDPGGQRQMAVQWMEGAVRIETEEPDAPLRSQLMADFYDGALRALKLASEQGTLDPADLDSNELWGPLRVFDGFDAVLAAASERFLEPPR